MLVAKRHRFCPLLVPVTGIFYYRRCWSTRKERSEEEDFHSQSNPLTRYQRSPPPPHHLPTRCVHACVSGISSLSDIGTSSKQWNKNLTGEQDICRWNRVYENYIDTHVSTHACSFLCRKRTGEYDVKGKGDPCTTSDKKESPPLWVVSVGTRSDLPGWWVLTGEHPTRMSHGCGVRSNAWYSVNGRDTYMGLFRPPPV